MGTPLASRSSFASPVALRVTNDKEMDVAIQQISMSLASGQKPVVIGLAADSGCGKSTFMRRVTACFGGACKLNPIGRETNTLISDMTTVICLDDYHLNDRQGRKKTGLTALDPRENNFDLMYEQVKALKEGKKVMKPIYNHVNGTLDEAEEITPTPIIIFEGLHPFYDKRVEELMDFKIYVDITPEVKFNWKVQRDHEERGHSIESIKQQIEARKPDFDAYIDPQKNKADCVIQVLPTNLVANDKTHLNVKLIQCKGVDHYAPTYLWDEGSDIEWVPPRNKLASSAPGAGLKIYQKTEKWAGKDAAVIGMDGKYDKIDEMMYVEKQFASTGSKFVGEITKKMLEYEGQPGSNDGTGFLQTITALKVREVYEGIAKVKVPAQAN
uniref:Phosphoribulokinase n=1 Tax=Guillardia theta TaxID=55529 RepID=Q24LT4_GUITH|nr:chloroplast phosphoribulokinase [Guillardia theta]